MSTVSRYQGGAKAEVTYGTAVTPDRFWEMISDTVAPQYARLDSQALRPGFTMHSDTFATYLLGAQGQLKFEVQTKGFGFWLKQMLGTVGTTGPVSAIYTHTATMADLVGTMFTWQGNRPTFPSDADQAFTFPGCKVTKWKLENQQSGLLQVTLDVDSQSFTSATALATASYPTGNALLSFAGGYVTLGGSQVDLADFSLEVDNQMKVDRRYLRGSALKKEPVENSWRAGTWTATADFDSMTQLNRISSATAAGTLAAIVAYWSTDGTTGAGIPLLRATIPAARFDEGHPTVSGPARLTQPLKGQVRYDGTNSPVTLEYLTTDSTP